MADAEFDLFGTYRYGFMKVPIDYDKALDYMYRVLLHGDAKNKFNMARFLAGAFYSNKWQKGINKDFPVITYNLDSTEYYVRLALELKPNDSNNLVFLGSIYAEKGNYPDAINCYLQSDNISFHIKAAEWMIKGEGIEKDVERGLQIFYDSIEKVNKITSYMSTHPRIPLNKLYYCDQVLTKEQLKDYLYPYFDCP